MHAFGLRGPPTALVHVPTTAAAQAASFRHGTPELPGQLAHVHFRPGAPLQFGLLAARVWVTVPSLVLVRSTGSVAIKLPGFGGQSRLVLPNDGMGESPFLSQPRPERG